MKFWNWYDSHYKHLLILPALMLLFSLVYIGMFYAESGSIIYKDVSLTGGTSFTISTDYDAALLEGDLAEDFSDYTVRGVHDSAGNQVEVIVTAPEAQSSAMQDALESILGFTLTDSNSSIEFTSSALSSDFFNQLIIAVLLAFFGMAAVVFLIFAKGWKVKSWIIVGNLVFAFFLGNFFFALPFIVSLFVFLAFAFVFIRTYIHYSVPAFAVMLSAFADIIMTLTVVNLLGMRLSTAGIVAFLMIIGYSVDTDILMTTRVLNKKGEINDVLRGAFVTGITMGVTSILAIGASLFIVYSYGSVLNQIFGILLIGLMFDIFNTWITNASILKWYAEVRL